MTRRSDTTASPSPRRPQAVRDAGNAVRILVNLDDAELRRARMFRQLAHHGITVERLGFDFRALPRPAIRTWFAAQFPAVRIGSATLSGAELGCWASHLSAWARILEAGGPTGTVLEDDLELAPAFGEALRTLERDPGEHDVVFLGTSSRNLSMRRVATLAGLRIHAPVGMVVNTWGYVVRRSWLDRLFARPVFELAMPLDHFLGGRVRGVGPRIGVLQPPCVTEDRHTARVSQIAPHTWRVDRWRLVEAARRHFLESRAGGWYRRIYRWL